MSTTSACLSTARLALSILAGCSMALQTGPSFAAKECKPEMTAGSGIFPTDALAVTDARASWTAYVTGSYGLVFSNWANAESKSQTCRTVTTPVGVNGRQCRIKARPCRHT